MPLYLAIFGPSSNSELELGLMISQGILAIGTFFLLILSLILSGVSARSSHDEEPHDR